jgi:GT2 family glycosyltransferase
VNSVKDYSCVRKVLVVDNHSKDDSLECLKFLENDKVVVVDSGENKGYGAGNNFGIKYLYEHYQSEYILLSNPDVIVEEKVLVELENFLRQNGDYAIAAPFMLNAKGVKQYNTAFRIPSKWEYILSIGLLLTKIKGSFYYKNIESEKAKIKDVGSVTGSMFMMRTRDMLDYGMYDENIFLYCEELVIGIKMQNAKKKMVLLTDCSFIHNHSVSISKTYKSLVAKQCLFMKSKLYAIKHYYHANEIEYFVALILSKLSIAEMFMISLLNRFK